MHSITHKTCLIAGAVDYGTASITNVLESYFKPEQTIRISEGARALGWSGLLRLRRRLAALDEPGRTIICAFHAPVLAGALLSRKRKGRLYAINAWTAGHPSLSRGMKMRFYNRMYARVPGRFDRFFSHSERFIQFYRSFGAKKMENFLLPLPYVSMSQPAISSESKLRFLFIGADYKRKGGDVLLRSWAERRPAGATLTFVCPEPPPIEVKGVAFKRDISAGSPEHRELFQLHDVFVLPTIRDEYGFAALEALNFGQLVVTTETAGIAALIAEAGGHVAPNPTAAIDWSLNLPRQRERVSEGRIRAFEFLEEYSHRLTKQREDLFQPVIHNRA